MDEIIFRRMTLGDVGIVTEMDKICFGEDSWDEEFFIDEVLDKNSVYVVAEIDGKVIACCGIKIYDDRAEGTTIAVLPKFQRLGIGKKILIESIIRVQKLGAKDMAFEVRVDNDPAMHVYRKFGFRIIGRVKDYYMDGTDAFVMYAKLEDLKCKLLSEQ